MLKKITRLYKCNCFCIFMTSFDIICTTSIESVFMHEYSLLSTYTVTQSIKRSNLSSLPLCEEILKLGLQVEFPNLWHRGFTIKF